MTENTQNMTMTFAYLKHKLYGFIGVGLILGMFFPMSALAQGSIAFSVSPTIYDMTANPGQVWQSTVRIINPNPFELKLSVTPHNFIPKDEDGVPQFIPLGEPSPEKATLGEWIQTEKEITIAAEQTYELPFTIRVPEGATPGGHYAALLISTEPADSIEANGGQLQTAQVISSLIFLRVTGDINEQGSIRSFRSVSYFLSKPETRFEVRIENRGNIHLQPQGEIKIYNMWGKERGTIPINQQTMLGNVLPQSVRKFSFEWSSEWSISDIGRYTAEATFAYGKEERQFMSANTAFWIIPWKILLVVFLVLGSLIAVITWAIKLYIRRVLALAGVAPQQNPIVTAEPVKEPKAKVTKTTIKAKDFTAPIGVSILDLRSKLQKSEGTWLGKAYVYAAFVKVYWKFFAGAAAITVLIALLVWFFAGALTPERSYEVVDPISGSVIASSETENAALPTGLGLPITLVNRTNDDALLRSVADRVVATGFTIAATSSESGAPEERTVIVYNPEVSEQAVLLSKTLNNALLSSYTMTSTSTEKIVVYVGSDALPQE